MLQPTPETVLNVENDNVEYKTNLSQLDVALL